MTKLEEMLYYVSKHNTYYKDIINRNGINNATDIAQYPVLTRKQLQDNRYNIFSDGYKAKYYSKQLRRQYSSGTSGVPINVYWDEKDYRVSMLSLWRKRGKYYGIKPSDKCIKFTLQSFDKISNSGKINYIQEKNNIILISRASLINDDSYHEVCELICHYMPKWLYIQPYILSRLLRVCQDHGIQMPCSLKYIEVVGELFSPELQKKALNYFNVPVVNMYGSEEMNGIAYQCPYHNMHIMQDNVFIECKRDDAFFPYGDGEAVITNLNNKAMPLIRYNQGDIISIKKLKSTCLCGSDAPVIEVIKGRKQDAIKLKNFEINSFTLVEIIDELNNCYGDPIVKYKYSYNIRKKELNCGIIISQNMQKWKNEIYNDLKKIFENKVPDKNEVIFVVSDLQNEDESGKFNVIKFGE